MKEIRRRQSDDDAHSPRVFFFSIFFLLLCFLFDFGFARVLIWFEFLWIRRISLKCGKHQSRFYCDCLVSTKCANKKHFFIRCFYNIFPCLINCLFSSIFGPNFQCVSCGKNYVLKLMRNVRGKITRAEWKFFFKKEMDQRSEITHILHA